ncbi:hypothetical protein BDZ94DRAFT_1306519 [Collybia nuda]|uniref:Uncharacterized protein n=1 Tax=Collybia nuda TaxID=64659 RepID=A0A9P5YE18_9AGAR|nr:hypothetical protein BDZ94DRAFT_1306519 [Collybia nuda]
MPCIVNRETSVVPVVFLGLATLFLILSCVSAPLLDGVRLFRVYANISGTRRYVDFGIWGYCIVPIRGLRGFDPNVTEGCSSAKLGYTIGEVVTKALRTSGELQDALLGAHTSALVLFPIATIYTAFTLLVSTVIWLSLRLPKGGPSIGTINLNSIVAIAGLGTLITTATFAIALSVMVTVKSKVSEIRHSQGNLELKWDSVIWLSAFAAGAHFYNLIFVNAMRKQQKKDPNWPNDEEASAEPERKSKNERKEEQKPKEKKGKGKKGKKAHKEDWEGWNEERRESVSDRSSESSREDVCQEDTRNSRESVASGQKVSQ